MNKRRWMLATIAEDAAWLAAVNGLGLEIDEFCTAQNMDDGEKWIDIVRAHADAAPPEVFHAPFAELYPCAIDPKARALAMERFMQAADMARGFGIRRMVAHGGFLPKVYFPIWYEEQSANFWRDFLAGQPDDFELLIENVLEDDPRSMMRMLDAVGDSRAGICLDAGHANVASRQPVSEWISTLGGRIRHVHLHDNHGEWDEHLPPGEGGMDIAGIMEMLDAHAPNSSVTLECMDARGAADWLKTYINRR